MKRLAILALILSTACDPTNLFENHLESAKSIPGPNKLDDPVDSWTLLDFTPTRENYADCTELQIHLDNRNVRRWDRSPWQNEERSEVAQSIPASSSSQSDSQVTDTNVQESGIDEGDWVKFSNQIAVVNQAHQLITIDTESLEIVGAYPHELPADKPAGLFLDSSQPFLPYDTRPTGQLYTYQDQVVQLMEIAGDSNSPTVVRIRQFQVAVDGRIELAGERFITGFLRDSRLVANHLITVSQKYMDPDQGLDVRLGGLNCDEIAKAATPELSNQLVRVSRLNLDLPNAELENLGFLGHANHLYMSPTTLYLTQDLYYFDRHPDTAEYNLSPPPNPEDRFSRSAEISVITKIDISAELRLAAVGHVPGFAKDQWSFKELDSETGEKVLSVATTQLFSNGWDRRPWENYLWVLGEREQELATVGSVEPFGLTEEIRAVRYLGHKAYVVTFKKTDPLFGFDLANPYEPQVVDELKIPGFSTYLHPVDDELMIGVGFDTTDEEDFALFQGIKVSLFRLSEEGFAEVATKTYGERGSFSDATFDHHAFYWDQENRVLAIPLVTIASDNSDTWSYEGKVTFSGSVVIQVSGEELVEVGRMSHQEWVPEKCQNSMSYGRFWTNSMPSHDINRTYRIGEEYFTFSRYGIQTYSDNLGELRTLPFSLTDDSYSTCEY